MKYDTRLYANISPVINAFNVHELVIKVEMEIVMIKVLGDEENKKPNIFKNKF